MNDYPALRAMIGLVYWNQEKLDDFVWDAIKSIGMKSQLQYQAVIYNISGHYVTDQISGSYSYNAIEWTYDFVAAIEQYLTEAWMAGMAENGIEPDEMTPDWQGMLNYFIEEEKSHLPDLAAYLTEIAEMVEPIDAAWPRIHARLDVWANRWEDIKNRAILETGEKKAKYIWVYGDTDHCETCIALNGIVAWAEEWQESGVHPQSPPNTSLECGGWRCQCELIQTDNRRTPRALQTIMRAVGQ